MRARVEARGGVYWSPGYTKGTVGAAAGYEVSTAHDAISAGYQVLKNPPDLILSDVNMPHMDGFEFVAALKAWDRSLAIPRAELWALGVVAVGSHNHVAVCLVLKAAGGNVRDLKTGSEAIEERARSDLGMIRGDEVFFQVQRGAADSWRWVRQQVPHKTFVSHRQQGGEQQVGRAHEAELLVLADHADEARQLGA